MIKLGLAREETTFSALAEKGLDADLNLPSKVVSDAIFPSFLGTELLNTDSVFRLLKYAFGTNE